MKKLLKYSLFAFICCMATILSACSLYLLPGQLSQRQWSDAFNYNGKRIITTTMPDEYGGITKTYIDGYKVKIVDANNQTSYMFYDGTKYWSYIQTSNMWTKTEIEEDTYLSVTSLDENMFPYSEFTYDFEKNNYTATDLQYDDVTINRVDITFKNNKIDKITVDMGTYATTIEFSYGKNISVNLPEIDGDQGGDNNQGDGEEETGTLTQSQWSDAINYSGKRQIKLTVSSAGTEQTGVCVIDDYKAKITYDNQTSYMDYDGTKYWSYTQVGNKWTKTEITYEQYYQKTVILSESMYPYSEFTYNQQENLYYAQGLQTEMGASDVTIKFENNKVKEIITKSESSFGEIAYTITTKMEFAYENTSVTLPQVDEQESGTAVSEEVWNNAFNYNDDFTITSIYESEYGSGTSYVLKKDGDIYEIVSANDGTTYVELSGEKYIEYYKQDEKWYKKELFLYDLSGYIITGLSYEDFEYDSENGCYVVENYTRTEGFFEVTYDKILVKLVNDKIIYIEEQATMFGQKGTQKYYYTYDDVTITLPEASEKVD